MIAKKVDPPSGWFHTPTPGGETQRLVEKIPTIKDRGKRPDSLDRIAFLNAGTEETYEDSDSSDLQLEPGCFVELRKGGIAVNAVILGTGWQDRKLVFTALTSKGEMWTHSPDNVLFDVPSFISTQLVEQCGTALVATTKSELEGRVEVLKKLRDLNKMCDDAMNVISSKGLDIYDTVRAKEDNQWAETTLSEVATLLVYKPTLAHILSAHKYLISNPIFFVASHDYVTSRKFLIRPFSDVQRIKKIREWTKGGEGHHNLEGFVAKVKRILSVASHTWTSSEMEIIMFLIQYLRPVSLSQTDPYAIGVHHIMKLIYETGDIYEDVIHRILLDIGALAPWQDLTEISETFKIDVDRRKTWEEPGGVVERTINKLTENNDTSSPYTPTGQVLGPEDFYPTDSASHIRHDFGSLPVYVIDDPDAKELDDGISIEPISSDPSQTWIHVHVADPTALLPPTHILAKHAELKADSVYMYQQTYPMLPKSFTHHPERGLSLSCTPGKPQNTLTFSVKVDVNDGLIRDYVVRPGLVRNLVVLSYDEANAKMGLPVNPYSYPFGGAPPMKQTHSLSDSAAKDLRAMFKITRAFVARRFREGIFTSSRSEAGLFDINWPKFSSPSPTVALPPLSTDPDPSSSNPTYTAYTYTGSFPSMSYRTETHSTAETGAKSLVAEAMKLAARAASMFARDRDLPLIRRSAGRPLVASEEARQDLLDARMGNTDDPVLQYNSYLPLTPHSIRLQANIIAESAAAYTTSIQGHWGLGVPDDEGYTRCTSPLRRYSDLVMHWQIKHALIQEAKGVKGRGLALYSKEELDSFAVRTKAAERFKRRLSGNHLAFWHIGWLMRFLGRHDPENYESTSNSVLLRNSAPGYHSHSKLAEVQNPFLDLKGIALAPAQISGETRRRQGQVGLHSLGIKGDLEVGTELEVRPTVQLKLKK
ncbi:RNB-domain-containing protein [Gymnopus androsaceus JB14]|uniref:RNB-domain-containing protein n=1 Tax=Gymnopus androsaceus JB14 TaxID=1447944 RepID=A0A6A4HJS8_9AGAR|nr:RNB-domain-containing protein [Gymnopus androsaceus JB14]